MKVSILLFSPCFENPLYSLLWSIGCFLNTVFGDFLIRLSSFLKSRGMQEGWSLDWLMLLGKERGWQLLFGWQICWYSPLSLLTIWLVCSTTVMCTVSGEIGFNLRVVTSSSDLLVYSGIFCRSEGGRSMWWEKEEDKRKEIDYSMDVVDWDLFWLRYQVSSPSNYGCTMISVAECLVYILYDSAR